MKRYNLKIHAYAEQQLDDIKEYLLHILENQQATLNFLDETSTAIDSLRIMPERIPLVRYEPWCSRGLRCMVVKNYLIYFWIDETAQQVNIIAVIYGKRDQASYLEVLMTD